MNKSTIYTDKGWMVIEVPPFFDLEEECRRQDEEDERRWQQAQNKEREHNE